MNEVLTGDRVYTIFIDSMFNDGEDTSNAVNISGIVNDVRFNPVRLEIHKAEIEEMLNELPDGFKATGGGGWSFLEAANDRHGNQWADLHRTMEQLFLLGLAIDKVVLLTPRDMWEFMPGGMPYYQVK